MKYIVFIMFVFSTVLFAQETITVNKSDLPKELLTELEAKETLKNTKESISEYVGIGKEIGLAINEGLKAVVDQAEHFGNTKVGNFTLFMIAWSILAEDFLGFIIGVPVFFIGLFLMLKYYRLNYSNHKILKSKSGFFLWPKKEYEYIKCEASDEAMGTASILIYIFVLVWVGVCCAIIF